MYICQHHFIWDTLVISVITIFVNKFISYTNKVILTKVTLVVFTLKWFMVSAYFYISVG